MANNEIEMKTETKNSKEETLKVGVLALQGDIKEHKAMLRKCNAIPVEVRLPEDMKEIKGLIIPGGESTTIGKLMKMYNLDKEIKKKYNEGMPVYGTCAGAILLAKEIVGSEQPKLGLMGILIKRNSYGRQVDSFEADLAIKNFKRLFRGVFIRAPVIESVYDGVDVLSEFNNKPIIVKQGNLLASTFHPELTKDIRIHNYFVEMVKRVCS